MLETPTLIGRVFEHRFGLVVVPLSVLWLLQASAVLILVPGRGTTLKPAGTTAPSTPKVLADGLSAFEKK